MRILNNRFLLCLLCGLYPSIFYISENQASLVISDSAILVIVLCLPVLSAFTLFRFYEHITFRDTTRLMSGICLSIFFVYMFSSVRSIPFISNAFESYSFDDVRSQFIISTVITSALSLFFLSAIREAMTLALGVGLMMSLISSGVGRETSTTGIISTQAENITFQRKPNVYYILPDGYQDPHTIRELFGYDITQFQNYLESNRFVTYDPFYANYYSTLNSTSSLFSMSHHYYAPVGNKRKIVGGNNKVVNTFRHNGYDIVYVHSGNYLLLHGSTADVIQPSGSEYLSLRYTLRNIFIGFAFAENHPDYKMLTAKQMNRILGENIKSDDTPKFFFIYYLGPGHIDHLANKPVEHFLQSKKSKFDAANVAITGFISTILALDKTAIIAISGDHGTFMYDAPLKSWQELYVYTAEQKKLRTRFGTLGAIRWPSNYDGRYDSLLRSNVNMFRMLFAWLADDDAYAHDRVPDDSYFLDFINRKVFRAIESGQLLRPPVLFER